MLRSWLIRKVKGNLRLSRTMTHRRKLHTRSNTPLHFLKSLGLISPGYALTDHPILVQPMAWSEQLKPFSEEVETHSSVKEGVEEGGPITAEDLFNPGEASSQTPQTGAAKLAQADRSLVHPIVRSERLETFAEEVETSSSIK